MRDVMQRRSVRRASAAALALLLVLAGCSGVPTTSVPQVVSTINGADDVAVNQTITPAPKDDPRAIVTKFLQAGVDADDLHQEAKQFLVPGTSWNSSTVTIVQEIRVRNPDRAGLSVTGVIVGTLDESGAYSPVAQTATSPNAEHVFRFAMAHTAAGWRIRQPPVGVGLLISLSDFLKYGQRQIYFFNQAETRLVPDLRYSPAQGQSLATWLVAQLLAGPQLGGQAPAVRRNEVPSELATARAKVTLKAGDLTVQLPGIAQAGSATIGLVAAELAYTLGPAFNLPIRLTDLSGPVRGVPQPFDMAMYPKYAPLPTLTSAQMFYVRAGGLIDSANRPVAGLLGTNEFQLGSVAVGDLRSGDRPVAGLNVNRRKLAVGSMLGVVTELPLRAPATSRPELFPGAPIETWVGLGPQLVRVVGSKVVPVSYTAQDGVSLPGRTVTAVRFSPEGARVAMVLKGNGAPAVWIGQVSRTGPGVQIVDMRQITPKDWYVVDVAWASSVQLRLIDSAPTATSEFAIHEVRADGLTTGPASQPPVFALPDVPQYITAQVTDSPFGGQTWVSVTDTLWQDPGGGQWAGQPSFGQAPVYSN